jgi:hypothetical protein
MYVPDETRRHPTGNPTARQGYDVSRYAHKTIHNRDPRRDGE